MIVLLYLLIDDTTFYYSKNAVAIPKVSHRPCPDRILFSSTGFCEKPKFCYLTLFALIIVMVPYAGSSRRIKIKHIYHRRVQRIDYLSIVINRGATLVVHEGLFRFINVRTRILIIRVKRYLWPYHYLDQIKKIKSVF